MDTGPSRWCQAALMDSTCQPRELNRRQEIDPFDKATFHIWWAPNPMA
jgi:hypothetical protein